MSNDNSAANMVALNGQIILNGMLNGQLAATQSQLHAARMANIAASAQSAGEGIADAMKRAKTDRLLKQQAALIEELKKDQTNADVVAAHEKEKAELRAKIAEKENLIKEWMLSNESFKRLAKTYATKAGISTDEQLLNRRLTLVEIAEKDPNLGNTELSHTARRNLAQNKK